MTRRRGGKMTEMIFLQIWYAMIDADVGKSLSDWKAPARMMGGKKRTRKSDKGTKKWADVVVFWVYTHPFMAV